VKLKKRAENQGFCVSFKWWELHAEEFPYSFKCGRERRCS
jgi:hypothetical protein